MVLLIVLLMSIKASSPQENILVINELGTFEKNMTYKIETDRKGEITIKAKGSSDRRWSPAYRFNNKSGAEELHLDGTIVVNTQEKQCVLAYVEELDGRSLKPVSGSFKLIEYRKLNGESISSGLIYTSTPRMEDVNEGEIIKNKKEKTYFVESTMIIFILVLFFSIIIRMAII